MVFANLGGAVAHCFLWTRILESLRLLCDLLAKTSDPRAAETKQRNGGDEWSGHAQNLGCDYKQMKKGDLPKKKKK